MSHGVMPIAVAIILIRKAADKLGRGGRASPGEFMESWNCCVTSRTVSPSPVQMPKTATITVLEFKTNTKIKLKNNIETQPEINIKLNTD